MGLEYIYNKDLTGTSGKVVYQGDKTEIFIPDAGRDGHGSPRWK